MLNFIFGMIIAWLLVDCILMIACSREQTQSSIFRFLIYLPFAPLMIIDMIKGNWKTIEEEKEEK